MGGWDVKQDVKRDVKRDVRRDVKRARVLASQVSSGASKFCAAQSIVPNHGRPRQGPGGRPDTYRKVARQ